LSRSESAGCRPFSPWPVRKYSTGSLAAVTLAMALVITLSAMKVVGTCSPVFGSCCITYMSARRSTLNRPAASITTLPAAGAEPATSYFFSSTGLR
jgi:hypothetical protein